MLISDIIDAIFAKLAIIMPVYGRVNLIPFEGRLFFPSASSWINLKAYTWDKDGKLAP